MRKALSSLIIVTVIAFFNTMALATVNDDQVTSQKLKEADGTSGQNTNSGSGVKTNHIQNDAVTSTKIANGAVTDAKISGQISASKINSTGLNADTVDGKHASDLAAAVHTHSQSQVTGLEAAIAGKSDVTHNHDSIYQQKYGKVAVVAQTGGDYTNPVAAINDIAAWCGEPSSTNPCLVKIMPGIYDLGAGSVGLAPFVNLEGSGENITRLIYNGSNGGVFIGASTDSEIRMLTLDVYAGSGYSPTGIQIGVADFTGAPVGNPVRVTNVTINSTGPGYLRGINIYNRSPIIDNVTINSAWNGIEGLSNYPSIYTSNPIVKNSRINASVSGIYLDLASIILKYTEISAPYAIGAGRPLSFKCIGVYDGNLDPITCQ
jgi:hypothetical protein